MFVDDATTSGVDDEGTRFAEAQDICVTKVIGRVIAIESEWCMKSEDIALRSNLLERGAHT
jgi:hypothetical protein